MSGQRMNQRPIVPPTFRAYAEGVGRENGFEWTEHALERAWERRVDPDHTISVALNPSTQIFKQINGRMYHQIWGEIMDGRTVYVCLDEHKTVIISTGWRSDEDQNGKF